MRRKAMAQIPTKLFIADIFLGGFGGSLWVLANTLRSAQVNAHPLALQLIQVLPNFGATLLLLALLLLGTFILRKPALTRGTLYLLTIATFSAVLLSEILFWQLSNAGFDFFDMGATLGAIALFLGATIPLIKAPSKPE